MRRFWAYVTEPILRQRCVKRVVEIGSQSGESTRRLLELCKELGAHADIIDPLPAANQLELDALLRSHGKFHLAKSLAVLPSVPVADAYLIDGDHNWYTVHHELLTIDDQVNAAGSRPPVILMHDVGWPYARRDLYYDPDDIPSEARHPFSKAGVLPDEAEADPEGGLNRHLMHANLENGARNGVRTAVDDFLLVRSGYTWWSLPVYHGYGFIVHESELNQAYALAIERMCTENPTLLALAASVERARVEAMIAAETNRFEVKEQQRRMGELERTHRSLEQSLEQTQARLEEIEQSRGYRALEAVRNVRRRLRRVRS